MDDNEESVILIITAILIIIFGGLFLVRIKDTILIERRYWQVVKAYKYVEYVLVTDTDCSTDSDGEVHCTTSTDWERRVRTRCSNYRTGEVLPPREPETMPCSLMSGDYESVTTNYYVRFVILKNDRVVTRLFNQDLWYNLEPGTRRYVIRNGYGQILKMAEE